MPVDGYEHAHLWLYRFKFRYPWPLRPILDPDWDESDQEWQWNVVERLQRGEHAALHSALVNELIPSTRGGGAAEGWEGAEEYSKDADRSGSPWLNDYAIARRTADRELRKKVYAEWLAENKVRLEKERIQREAEQAKWAEVRKAEEAERAEANRVWREQQAERDRIRAEQDAEWRAAAERRLLPEEQMILSSLWHCNVCKRLAEMKPERGGYALECKACGTKNWAEHAKVARIVRAG